MNAQLPSLEARRRRCRENINRARDLLSLIENDLSWISRFSKEPALIEADMADLAKKFVELGEHATEVHQSIRQRRIDGDEADARLDAMIAGTVQ